MTEFNQRVSAITRKVVETRVPVQITRHGQPVLRLFTESTEQSDPVTSLLAAGLASPPTEPRRAWKGTPRIPLSGDLDELLDELRADSGS